MKRLPVSALEATGDRTAQAVLHGNGTWGPASGVLVTDTLPDAAANRDELAVVRGTAGGAMLGSDGLHPNDTGMTYLADHYRDRAAERREDASGRHHT